MSVRALDSILPTFYNPAVLIESYGRKLARTKAPWLFLALLLFAAGCDILIKPELTITWKTESELDIIGFNLLRSESEAGPFVKINPELIPPASDPNVGGDHQYVDRDVISGVTYFYILESIDRQGNATRSDPIAITAGR